MDAATRRGEPRWNKLTEASFSAGSQNIEGAMSAWDEWLQRAYWLSQISLALVAICAAWIALNQVRALKLFELLKYVKDPHIIEARRIVIREIGPKKDNRWWEEQRDGFRLNMAASTVCASYDLIGRMALFDKIDTKVEDEVLAIFLLDIGRIASSEPTRILRAFSDIVERVMGTLTWDIRGSTSARFPTASAANRDTHRSR
jgi:hypothetical protein